MFLLQARRWQHMRRTAIALGILEMDLSAREMAETKLAKRRES
jgi:hypothetical protein